jgi:hypothetical protein
MIGHQLLEERNTAVVGLDLVDLHRSQAIRITVPQIVRINLQRRLELGQGCLVIGGLCGLHGFLKQRLRLLGRCSTEQA